MPERDAVRLFVGFKVGDAVRQRIAEFADELRPATAGFRWTRVDQLHLTLTFLGDVSAARINEVVNATVCVARKHAAFEIEWRHLGCFPSPSKANILWMGVGKGTVEATALHTQLAHAYSSIGLPPDQRFTPHVTLARARDSRSKANDLRGLLRDRGQEDFGIDRIGEVVVFRSDASRGGPAYTPVAVARLANG
jgi:2'-5' RNA ligase